MYETRVYSVNEPTMNGTRLNAGSLI